MPQSNPRGPPQPFPEKDPMEIDLDDLETLEDPLLVDVRSPAEHAEDHLPGAINLPVLTNEERDRVGTIYNQHSPSEARRIGAGLICGNVPDLLERLEQRHRSGQPIVVYCWRGGQRSGSLAVILDRIGYPTHRLSGGYKAYRKRIHDYLRDGAWPRPLVAVYGLTGSGKTRLLGHLDRRGTSVLDLERAAGHRGSTFGDLGLPAQPSQKAFERRLYRQLRDASPPVLTEGESRMIGRRKIPDRLFERLTAPPRVWLETDFDRRVENIARVYDREEALLELQEDLRALVERLGRDRVRRLRRNLDAARPRRVIRTLLREYYDPAYRRSVSEVGEFDLRVTGDDLEEAARRIRDEFGEAEGSADDAA